MNICRGREKFAGRIKINATLHQLLRGETQEKYMKTFLDCNESRSLFYEKMPARKCDQCEH
ncbi:MAG: hypothetical protein WB759_01120, partial [Methanoregula sp.]